MKITPQQIESWVGRHFPYKKVSNGRQLRINNPFDPLDNDYHFWISLEETILKRGPKKGSKNYWAHDFRFSKHSSSFVGFVKKFKNIDYHQAIRDITGNSDDYRSTLIENKKVDEETREVIIELPKGSKLLKDYSNIIIQNYLNNRKVNQERIEKYQLYSTPTSIVFPYFEYGDMVFWQSREVLNKAFKFPDSKLTGLKKTDFVFGFDMVEPYSELFIVESIFNSISIGDNCIATGGAIIAGKQKLKITALRPSIVILAPDHDEAGIASLIRNYYELRNDFKIGYCLPLKGLDWNDMDQKNMNPSEFIRSNYRELSLVDIIRFKQMA